MHENNSCTKQWGKNIVWFQALPISVACWYVSPGWYHKEVILTNQPWCDSNLRSCFWNVNILTTQLCTHKQDVIMKATKERKMWRIIIQVCGTERVSFLSVTSFCSPPPWIPCIQNKWVKALSLWRRIWKLPCQIQLKVQWFLFWDLKRDE